MKLICQNCGNSRAGVTTLGTDKHFLFAGDQEVTFVNSRTKAEFTVPSRELVNSSFECPICAEKDSVRLSVETVT
ncbi:MAG: hypothetical protein E6R04_11440 [Spirochaetes bacterium]|nr:MAG: hypothetical protein E6R04_11440 [Spirochaetota bacterium]